MDIPQKNEKQSYHMIQRYHFWIFHHVFEISVSQVHCSTTDNSQGTDLIYVSNTWMDKENIVFHMHGKEYSTFNKAILSITCNNMAGNREHYAKGNEADRGR